MADSKHTPGVWTAALEGNGFNGAIYVMAGSEEICEVFDDSETAEMPAVANARLIAAAPDLLELLKRVAEADSSNDDIRTAWWEERAEAIAKATGAP